MMSGSESSFTTGFTNDETMPKITATSTSGTDLVGQLGVAVVRALEVDAVEERRGDHEPTASVSSEVTR